MTFLILYIRLFGRWTTRESTPKFLPGGKLEGGAGLITGPGWYITGPWGIEWLTDTFGGSEWEGFGGFFWPGLGFFLFPGKNHLIFAQFNYSFELNEIYSIYSNDYPILGGLSSGGFIYRC